MPRRISSLLRIGGVGAATLALAASTSVEGGERSNSGWCPAGEQCADDTPEGLLFVGQPVSWTLPFGVAPTAVGGIQVVGLRDRASDTPLDRRFLASVDNPDALAVAIGDGPEVVLTASQAGSGYLRISRVEDDYLFDRLEIESAEVARLDVFPSMDTSWLSRKSDWAVLAGGVSTELAIGLFDANGIFLIDESMAMATPNESLRTHWDALRLVVPAGTLRYEIAVETGSGFTGVASVPLVGRIDAVTNTGALDTLAVGHDAELCFEASLGERRVLGVPWTYEISGAAEPVPAAEQLHDQCIRVRATRPGSARVVATVNGLSSTVDFDAIAGTARQAMPAVTLPPAHDLGDRAAAAAADAVDTAE